MRFHCENAEQSLLYQVFLILITEHGEHPGGHWGKDRTSLFSQRKNCLFSACSHSLNTGHGRGHFSNAPPPSSYHQGNYPPPRGGGQQPFQRKTHTAVLFDQKKMMIYFINPTRGNSGFHMKRASERTDLESSFKNDLSWASCSPPASWHQLKCKWRFWGCTAQIMLGPAHHDDHPASPVKDADTLASCGCISISHTGFLLLVTSAFVDLNWWRSQSLSGCYKMFLYNREYIHGGRVIVASPEHFSLLKSERSLNAAFQMLVLCVFIFVCCGLRGVNSLNSSWGRGGCLCLSLAEGFVGE